MTHIENRSPHARTVSIVAMSLALVSYLFPFFSVNFLIEVSFTGIKLMGVALETGGGGLLFICLILSLVGLVCAAVSKKSKGAAIATIVLAALGMTFMFIFMSDDDDLGIINPLMYAGIGFYMYEIMNLAAIISSIITIRGMISVPPVDPPAKPLTPQTPQTPQRPRTASNVVCFCERGVIAGASVTGSRIVIGRDAAQCQLVFPANTPGISAHHCMVKVVDGNIVLSDLNSSYGTYLSHGQKLQPNSPVIINNGGYFFLADKKTVIRVSLS